MNKKKWVIACLVILLSAFACQSTGSSDNNSAPPSDTYLGLRNIWFTTKPEDLGIAPGSNADTPYAVVMDMGIGDGTTTIVSSIVGDGSLYTSTGGGVIGGVAHENVIRASKFFVAAAGRYVSTMHRVTEFPLPSHGNIRFYIITQNGVYTTDEVEADLLASGKHELSPLYLAGNDVITEIRITSGQ